LSSHIGRNEAAHVGDLFLTVAVLEAFLAFEDFRFLVDVDTQHLKEFDVVANHLAASKH
jgi:hypothetical protein